MNTIPTNTAFSSQDVDLEETDAPISQAGNYQFDEIILEPSDEAMEDVLVLHTAQKRKCYKVSAKYEYQGFVTYQGGLVEAFMPPRLQRKAG